MLKVILALAAAGLLAAWTHGLGSGGITSPKLDFSRPSNSMYVGVLH